MTSDQIAHSALRSRNSASWGIPVQFLRAFGHDKGRLNDTRSAKQLYRALRTPRPKAGSARRGPASDGPTSALSRTAGHEKGRLDTPPHFGSPVITRIGEGAGPRRHTCPTQRRGSYRPQRPTPARVPADGPRGRARVRRSRAKAVACAGKPVRLPSPQPPRRCPPLPQPRIAQPACRSSDES